MKHYIIVQPKEYGTYFRGDTVYTQISIKEILTNALTDPSDVSISITTPCGVAVVTDDAMVNSAVGYYDYDYSIPTDGCFGIYTIEISTATENSLTYFNFVLFPWDVLSRIRELSGAYQQSDMSDYKLAIIAWSSYKETLDEIYELHYKERPLCNSDGEWFDGINTDFKLKNYPFADHNGDGVITGHGELACCCEDITFRYYDQTTKTEVAGNVEVVDADSGLIQLTTLAGTPVPSNICRPQVTYYVKSNTYNEELMREAVAYLSAHKALVAMQSLQKATLADLQSNRDIEKQRFITMYESLVERIGFPVIGGGK